MLSTHHGVARVRGQTPVLCKLTSFFFCHYSWPPFSTLLKSVCVLASGINSYKSVRARVQYFTDEIYEGSVQVEIATGIFRDMNITGSKVVRFILK